MVLILKWLIWMFQLLGYPADVDGGVYQYVMNGKIQSCSNNWFKFGCPVTKGVSGAPVMRNSDNKIVGIVSKDYTYLNAGRAWRLSQDVLNLIINLRG